MTLYSRHQLVLLLVLVVASGVGLAIGEWRRANPGVVAAIEAIDRAPDDERAVGSAAVPVPAGPPAATPALVRRAAASAPVRSPRPTGPLDLNRASAAELTRLPGIGPVLAARIVAAREANGPFTSVDDLRRVGGVGPAKLAAFREHVAVPAAPAP